MAAMGIGKASTAVGVMLALAFSGCGGEDERIARERKEAADQARQQERLRQLEKELARDRRQSGKDSGQQSAPTAPAAPSPSGGSPCGGGLSVGPNTSCSFAQNVRDAYRESGGGSSIRVYSPVTKQTYTMSCTTGSRTVCTGGNNASVYFR